jgi:peptidoglycan/xylan/chitin deacetylase (PgdA/CDA1 family)
MNNPLTQLAVEQGYAVIGWTVSSADTTAHLAPATIAHNIIHTPNPGDIVLLHDGGGHGATAQALPQILKELGAAGWQFVTVPELLRAWDQWLATNPAPPAAPVAKKGQAHG